MVDADDVAQRTRWAVSRLAGRLRAQSGGERPLTRLAASVLANLRHSGPLTVTTLARIEGVQPQSLTRVLNQLADEDRIRRIPDEDDRRAQRVVVTEAGLGALEGHVRAGNVWLAQALAGTLSDAELTVVGIAADLLLRAADHQSDPEGEPALGAAPPL
ncbi:MarR family transcriptional regulator [Amycolatopsis keratiniphila]|uniref:MarR family transcriptional regulator n=1 Tax=Amycolatopsis keratiniphila subsp. keratiniphila TaxID=227715 RepID=A0A1W2M3B7_9PSEU|nr:MarR family transcriptional regulator [Amycolatopsis keratiniphila]ONF74508.1 MarR family transcriptional regulator [Amycolatopsis keratiniphila subsp. keratiniphila]